MQEPWKRNKEETEGESGVEIANKYLAAGLAVLPAHPKEKRPAVKWEPYQDTLPTENEISIWFYATIRYCFVCGKASGGLEMIDFDAKGIMYQAWVSLINIKSPGLLKRLVIERSPSGGYHICYRLEEGNEVPGNQKLAQREVDGKIETLIETRGEGGVFLCAPTQGYELIQGEFTNLSILAAQERDTLITSAQELNQFTPQTPPSIAPTLIQSINHAVDGGDNLRPGDVYNRDGDVREVLLKHGWALDKGGENEYWRRPGKESGNSATLKDNVFYVFSSNAHPFETEKPYSPFGVYTLLEHDGDFTAAAASLPDVETRQDDSDVDISKLIPAQPIIIPREHIEDVIFECSAVSALLAGSTPVFVLTSFIEGPTVFQ